MDTAQIMQAYNQFERRQLTPAGGEIIVAPHLVKFVSDTEYGSFISFFDFSSHQAGPFIQQEIEFFTRCKRNFEWKTYSTDSPSDIGMRLIEHGFVPAEAETFMALDLLLVPSVPPQSITVTDVTEEGGICDAITVQEQVWGQNFDGQFAYLLNMKRLSPEMISIYVVYVEGTPVASAWIIFTPNSPFGGIWGGSTLEAFRGQGYYTAMLNARIAEAKARGKRYLIIDASDMSRPIVTKYGFQVIAQTIGYHYQVETEGKA